MANGLDFSTFGYSDNQRKQLDVSKQMQGLQKKIEFANIGTVGVPEYKPIRTSRAVNFLKGVFNMVDASRAALATPVAVGMNLATNTLGPSYERSQKAAGATGPFAKWPLNPVRKISGDIVGPQDLLGAYMPSQDNVFWTDILKGSIGTPQQREAIDLMTGAIPHTLFGELDKAYGGQGFFGGLGKFGQFMTKPRIGDTSIVGAAPKLQTTPAMIQAQGLALDIGLDPLMYVNVGGGAVKAAMAFATRFKIGVPLTKSSMKSMAGISSRLSRALAATGKYDDPVEAADNFLAKYLQMAEGNIKYLDDPDNVKLLAKELGVLDDLGIKGKTTGFGYRAGDAGDVAEGLAVIGGGRGTGHFGSGAYFFSTKDAAKGYATLRTQKGTVSKIDLAGKNLFTPKYSGAAVQLHEVLKVANSNLDIKRVASLSDDAIDIMRKEIIELSKSNVTLYRALNSVDDSAGAFKVYKEQIFSSYPELKKYREIINLEFITKQLNKLGVNTTFDDVVDTYRRTFKEIEMAGGDVWNLDRADSISTRIMKSAGWDGVDVRHLKQLDNSTFGSVVYQGIPDKIQSLPMAKKIIAELKELDQAGQLFDRAGLRVAEWLPEGVSGRQLIKRPTAGTFERVINFGKGKQVKINVPRSVGIAAEAALAKKYPALKSAMDKLRKAFQSPKARPFGMQDVGEFGNFLRNVRKYESIKNWDLAENANYIKERIFDFIRKTGMSVDDQKVVAHTIELAKPTRKDAAMIRKIFDSLTKSYAKGSVKYGNLLTKNAKVFDIPEATLQEMLFGYVQSEAKMKGAVVDTLATHYALNRFDSAMFTVTKEQRELLWRVKQSLDESWMMMKPAYSRGYITHIYPSEGQIGQKLTETGRTTVPISAKYTSRRARKYDTLEDAINIGRKMPAEEAGFITAYEKLRTVNAYNTQKFVDETIESFGRRIKRRAQAGPHEGVFTDFYSGKTYAMPEFIADSLNKYADVMISPPSAKAFTKFYDKMIGLWKGYITATPGFTMRNVLMGNTWAGYMELGSKYFEPRAAKEGVQIFMAQFPGLVKKFPALRGKSSYNGMTFVELAQMAGQQGMYRGQVGYDLMAQMTMYDEFMSMLAGSPSMLNKINPLNQKNAYLNMFYKINSHAEDISKLIAFNLEMGRLYNDPVSSAMMVKRYFFDYSELTNVERMWFRRHIPFYTWMRKNIPLQIEELILQTGKYKVFPLGKKYIEDLSAGKAPDERYLPEYMQERYWIRTPRVDEWGNYLYFNPNFPPQDLAMLVNPNEWMSVLSPAIKIPLEIAMNRSTFFDSPIKENQWSLSYAPKWAKAIPEGLQNKLGMVESKEGTLFMDPMHRYMMDAIPTLKFINRFSLQDEAEKNKSLSLQAQAMFLGVKRIPYRYEDEKLNWLYSEKENMNEYLRMLRKIGVPTSTPGGIFD